MAGPNFRRHRLSTVQESKSVSGLGAALNCVTARALSEAGFVRFEQLLLGRGGASGDLPGKVRGLLGARPFEAEEMAAQTAPYRNAGTCRVPDTDEHSVLKKAEDAARLGRLVDVVFGKR
jgi:hypothetical protein